MRARLWMLIPALLASLCSGCGHESVTQPRTVRYYPLSASAATKSSGLDALWPNEDGREWEYQLYSIYCPGPGASPTPVYPSPDQVPAAPTPDEVVRNLPGDRPGPPSRTGGVGIPCVGISGAYTLHFRGEITTLSGVTAQNLEESFSRDSSPKQVTAEGNPSLRFLDRLAQARPDLRKRIEAVTGAIRPLEFALPVFLHGGAWEKTSDHVGTYGDLDQSLAWKFLGADVKPGSRFDFPLVPSLAGDVFLHALVVERSDAARLSGYAKELEVVYVVDYGVLAVVKDAADTTGFTRPVDYGSVIYVPQVGPVSDFERRGGFAGDIQTTPWLVDARLKTVTSGAAPLAIRE
jgi:hypothetical protein